MELLVQVQSEELSVDLGSYLGGVTGDPYVEAPGTAAHVDGLASVRAATRVKSEQAPKALMRVSSRPDNGEDPSGPMQTTEAIGRTRRGIGRSTYTHSIRQHGRSGSEPSTGHLLFGGRLDQKSEEPIVVRKPGNAGGAKGL